jgi:NADH-quinone oxidoreductase subunit C
MFIDLLLLKKKVLNSVFFYYTVFNDLNLFYQTCLNQLFLNCRFNFFCIEFITNSMKILNLLLILRFSFFIKLNLLIDIVVRDFFYKKLRFEITYLFLSIKLNLRCLISLFQKENTPILSILNFYKNANWFEREIWDLFGIFILNHLDLRRLLSDYNFNQFPLRKDFPLSGFFELYYNDTKKKIILTKISFLQDYRFFNLKNNWLGN